MRTGNAPLALGAAMGALQGRDIEPQVYFLEASDESLIRRFSETRHRHPLDKGAGIAASIQAERAMLVDVRADAHEVIDTTNLSARQLRERIQSSLRVGREPETIYLNVMSFGYKYGVPPESDIVFDVRFMENPFYVPELRQLDGLDRRGQGLRAGPAGHAGVPRLRGSILPLCDPGVSIRGQDPSDGCDRLHGRLSPLGRHRRGVGGAAARPSSRVL